MKTSTEYGDEEGEVRDQDTSSRPNHMAIVLVLPIKGVRRCHPVVLLWRKPCKKTENKLTVLNPGLGGTEVQSKLILELTLENEKLFMLTPM